MQINIEGEFLKKAKELDHFFIQSFFKNKWSLNKNVSLEAIKGFDEHGQGGLWKTIARKSYKVINNERKYLNYPSKMEFTLLYRNDKLHTKFFRKDKDKEVKEVKYYNKVAAQSKVTFIAAWFSLSRGTFELTLKPKLMQVKFQPKEDIFNECLLGSDREEED